MALKITIYIIASLQKMWLLTVNETPVFPLFLSLQHKLFYHKKLPALTIKFKKKKKKKKN